MHLADHSSGTDGAFCKEFETHQESTNSLYKSELNDIKGKRHAIRLKEGMKTTSTFSRLSKKIALAGFAITALLTQAATADIPDRHRPMPAFSGMYKVVASSDPMFPATGNKEWFLDFGLEAGKSSGTVAVSLRENPRVRVRIMVWQAFPEQNSLVLGNQTHEGSKSAVAMANWTVQNSPQGLVFNRGTYQVVLHQADASDY